jgi:hypothetical protein
MAHQYANMNNAGLHYANNNKPAMALRGSLQDMQSYIHSSVQAALSRPVHTASAFDEDSTPRIRSSDEEPHQDDQTPRIPQAQMQEGSSHMQQGGSPPTQLRYVRQIHDLQGTATYSDDSSLPNQSQGVRPLRALQGSAMYSEDSAWAGDHEETPRMAVAAHVAKQRMQVRVCTYMRL